MVTRWVGAGGEGPIAAGPIARRVSPAATGSIATLRGLIIMTTRIASAVHAECALRAPLDGYGEVGIVLVEAPGGPVDTREGRLDASLCSLIKLMGEAHHTERGREETIVDGAVEVVDARL
jgi:hypothetical protein